MKKIVALFLVIATLGVFMAGCSGGGDAAAGDAAKPAAEGEKK